MKTALPSLSKKDCVLYSGIVEAAVPFLTEDFLYTRYHQKPPPVTLLVAQTPSSAACWAEALLDLSKLRKDSSQLRLHLLTEPESNKRENGGTSPNSEATYECLATLTALNERSSDRLIIAATPQALTQPLPSPEDLNAGKLSLTAGQSSISPQSLAERLGNGMGYDAEALCEAPGQFALRGGLVDIYPLNAPIPVRVDFFDDTIESIRTFDPTTQRSEQSLKALLIAPRLAASNATNKHAYSLLDYLPETVLWFFHEPEQLVTAANRTPSNAALHFKDVLSQRQKSSDVYCAFTHCDAIGNALFDRPIINRFEYTTETLSAHYSGTHASNSLIDTADSSGFEHLAAEQAYRIAFLKQLQTWQQQGFRIHVALDQMSDRDRLSALLKNEPTLKGLTPRITETRLSEGFLFFEKPTEIDKGLIIATANELFGQRRPISSRRTNRRYARRSPVDQLLDFSEIAAGDLVVHLEHGICRFRGLVKLSLDGKEQEVLSLEFDQKAMLHLPLHESHLLSRYIGLSKQSPKLSRINASVWQKTCRAAETSAIDFAAQLLKVQASRSSTEGYAFDLDHPWQKALESAFPYDETADQLTALQTIKADMEQARPMERLLCGDVGFGKTEVVLRAAFKAVMSGKQVALLSPTTVLAQQHFKHFCERMEPYAIVVEMLSRFRTPRQQKTILNQIAAGKVDIIVGTHRLLSKDVHFKSLGLLIIDEEHRFGVRHKERIKALSHPDAIGIDVISLSATPIPRTLHLALSGARDMSLIETPPTNRLPIETIVKSYSTEIISQALAFERQRGGQVFYLHNRIATLNATAQKLQKLAPGIRIAVAHGGMDEGTLEEIMTRFVAHEYDVLAATTLIESGLDIPNANTLIIENAERFGLAQLYQLRGRVGRFNRQAYAYLLLSPDLPPHDDARKRLGAIRQYTQLGSGFRIAMRDLELRGAGNLLGPQQSGHIAGVGFDLYCQLLRQSVARLKGEKVAPLIRPLLHLDCVILGTHSNHSPLSQTIEAYIPESYLPEAALRVDSYRRLALAETLEEIKAAATTLQDRFGSPPPPVQALLLVAKIRCLAQSNSLIEVAVERDRLKCRHIKKPNDYIKTGARFPRLTASKPLAKLRQVQQFLQNLLTTEPS